MHSKLAAVGTNIFTTVNSIAAKYNALNLGQGFPGFDCSPKLIELVTKALNAEQNQYPPMQGMPQLREVIGDKITKLYDSKYCPEKEIQITPGGHAALNCTLTALVYSGDEVIVFEPAFDCFVPLITLTGATPIPIELTPPRYSIDWEYVASRVTEKTRAIIINSPHNPSGTILDAEDMAKLTALANQHDLLVLSDEVYEHIIFDGKEHQSVLRYPQLRERAISVFSFGKVFHTTGWKVGYCVAPESIMKEIRKVFQFAIFCTNRPIQCAMAEYLQDEATYLELPEFYQKKRDIFLEGLRASRFEFTPAAGTYFQAVSYKNIVDLPELEAVDYFCEQAGVAAIPVAPFYSSGANHSMLRFCFAKDETTLTQAAEKLCKI